MNRDGFVIAGGAGMLVLEEFEHAKARGARIHAELSAMASPPTATTWCSPRARARRAACAWPCAMSMAIDYINPHGTSTPIGDVKEIEAVREVFGDKCPPISATKSLTGHSLGAAGVHEAIYSLLMMNNGFICEFRQHRDHRPGGRRHADPAQTPGSCRHRRVMSNSFGFGGTNATLVFRRFDG